MKPFRFTLAAVQTLREQQEEQALEAYAAALRARAQAAEDFERIAADLHVAQCEWKRQLAKGCSVAVIIQQQRGCAAIEERQTLALAHLRNTEAACDRALGALLAARQAREGVDKLEKQQRRKYTIETSRAEQKILDDRAPRSGALTLAT